MNRWILPGVAALGLLIGAGAMWAADSAGAGPSRALTDRTIHDYLIRHPEVLPEAMQVLQDRQTSKVIADNRAAIETPVGSAWQGNPNGDVTLVEFYDYNCGYCRASLPTIAQLIRQDPKVKVVYRDYPILAPSSQDAARLSLAAAEQGKFQAFHDALYSAGPVSDATLAAAAKVAGVDVARAKAGTDAADQALHDNTALAQHLSMTGTPSWVVGDRVLVGAQTLDELEQAIAAARAR